MREERLELSHLAILEPKSSASTNSAIPAYCIKKYITARKLNLQHHQLEIPLYIYYFLKVAGIRGFEPLNDGIKTRCLTAWLYPCNVPTFYICNICCFEMVRVKRLELSHLAILEPKSSASTNSAKPALHSSF